MPKTTINDTQGILSTAGAGLAINTNSVVSKTNNISVGSATYGVHEVSYEIDIGGLTGTNTDDGLVKTICSFTTNIRVLQAAIICSESNNEDVTFIVDIAATADAITAADVAITPTGIIFDGLDLKSSSLGTAGDFNTPATAGSTDAYIKDGGATGDKIVLMNKGVGNNSAAPTSGKFVLYLKYLGSSRATALTTV
jgi:hypothetical protein